MSVSFRRTRNPDLGKPRLTLSTWISVALDLIPSEPCRVLYRLVYSVCDSSLNHFERIPAESKPTDDVSFRRTRNPDLGKPRLTLSTWISVALDLIPSEPCRVLYRLVYSVCDSSLNHFERIPAESKPTDECFSSENTKSGSWQTETHTFYVDICCS